MKAKRSIFGISIPPILALLAILAIAAGTISIGMDFATALTGSSTVAAQDDEGPGLKCRGCEAAGCPDVGSLKCIEVDVEVDAGPFGSVGGTATCYQSEAGSGADGCSKT